MVPVVIPRILYLAGLALYCRQEPQSHTPLSRMKLISPRQLGQGLTDWPPAGRWESAPGAAGGRWAAGAAG